MDTQRVIFGIRVQLFQEFAIKYIHWNPEKMDQKTDSDARNYIFYTDGTG